MVSKTHTTETLRETLFETIDAVIEKTITSSEASQVSSLAQTILKTADLELKYAGVISKIDKDDTGINPGPMLLAQKKVEGSLL